MTTPIKYRISSTATKPVSDTVKGAPLTSLEIDGNFRSIKDSIELIQSAYLPAGYSAPVDYVAGVILSSAAQTVAYQGEVYAPKAAEVPFTTSGTFEVTKFVQIQSVAGVDLAATNGAGLVGYMPEGTGAVAMTVQSKLLSVAVTPEEYGAVGDGVTDDTNALKKCHLAGKSVVYGRDKRYVVKSANVIPLIDGCEYDGNGATIVVAADANAPGINVLFRMGNNVFYRDSNTPLTADISIYGFNVEIKRSYWNFIGARDTSAYTSGGKFNIYGNKLKNNGTPSGLGGPDTATFSPGGFCVLAGYDCEVYDNEVYDCGVGIACTNATNVRVCNNRLYYCGVSRDFTSWSNAAALAVSNNTYIIAIDNYVYVTGGTSIFGRSEWRETKEFRATGNTVIGAGNTAIGAGYRGTQAINFTTECIVITDNRIYGATCGIDALEHGPVVVGMNQGIVNCRIKSVDIDVSIDYLAPWESFNYTTNDVDGTYNLRKKVGGSVGAQSSLQVFTDVGSVIDRVTSKVKIYNDQAYGIAFQNVKFSEVDAIIDNCAWGRTVVNAPNPACRSLQFKTCENISVKAKITNHARGVTRSDSLASAVEFVDNDTVFADLRIDKSNNQRAAVYVRQDKANCKLHFDALYFDNPDYVSGAPTTIIEAGTQVKASTVFTGNIDNTMTIGGNIYLPIGMKAVTSGGANYNLYVSSAKRSKNSRIILTAKAFSITLVVEGSETIDGATNPVVVAAGTRRTIYSDGTQWRMLD